MQVGIDSYSYHRLFGDIRPGERPMAARWEIGPAPVLEHARALEVDACFLETCFLPDPEELALPADGSPRLGFSWGHPWPPGQHPGLDGGRSPGAEADLARWIDLAGRLRHPVLRITAGGPATRGDEPAEELIGRLLAPLRRAADRAAAAGVSLAVENHGDLRADELAELLDRADRPNLGVCLDNVNLIRVGDGMVEGTALLAPLTLLVQLKDCHGDPGAAGGPQSTALGEGEADLDGVLAALREGGFDGPVCVELASLGPQPVDELAMIERSVAWLRANLEEPT